MHFYRCYSICIINVCVGHIVDIETTATVSLSIDSKVASVLWFYHCIFDGA